MIKLITPPLNNFILYPKNQDSINKSRNHIVQLPSMIYLLLLKASKLPYFILVYNYLSFKILKRQRAFGYGNKLDFTKSDKNLPSPNHYELSSTFETNKRKSKGATFSFGRDVNKKTIFLIILFNNL